MKTLIGKLNKKKNMIKNKKHVKKNKINKPVKNKILVLNSGSSSIKFQIFEDEKRIIKGLLEGIGLKTCRLKIQNKTSEIIKNKKIRDHEEAFNYIFDFIKKEKIIELKELKAIGHRTVHGGEKYKHSTIIDSNVISEIERLSSLAPLHNPHNLKGIKICKKLFPKIKQVGVFDTSFHQTIPEKAFKYAIPEKYYKKYKIRKYGFHGTSHQYVMEEAKKILKLKKVNLITCHLGNGCSVCAIKNNKSIDTSMGFTPLEGLIMGTRSGDLDPSLVEYISKKEKINCEKVTEILNKKSGLYGISGFSDARTINKEAQKKSMSGRKAKLAMEMFAYRVAKYIGSYYAILGRVDAIVFTAGIGEGGCFLRKPICDNLKDFGILLDNNKNKKNSQIISKKNSKCKIMIIQTNEELMIAKETLKLVK